MSKPRKPVPDFTDETAERAFWEAHDTADHVDWSTARPIRLPNLKPSTTAISLRLPVALLERIKLAANQRDVPYQSLIKLWLAEKVEGGRDRMASKG
jgi:predicted DNA binding CopG/RHH family protein